MTLRSPAAILWDMDGTLVDTEPYWMTAEIELVREFGGAWSHDDALQLVGSGLWESAKIFQQHGVDLEADAIVAHLTARVSEQLRTGGIPWRPGASELLEAVRQSGIPTALVTMSVMSMAEVVVEAIPFTAFDVIVTGDTVTHPKPHPEPYLRAAELLGVEIADCIAIEDSPPGVTSGAASGALTIGVPNILDLAHTEAHAVWPTLVDRDVADLRQLFTELREEQP